MVNVRLHPDDPRHPDAPTGCTGGGGRLNLLLSCAGWQADPWVERLPRLLEPLGIHSLHADTGAHATRLIRSHRIHVAVVDLGLPLDHPTPDHDPAPDLDAGGPRLLELLARLDEPPPMVAVKRNRTHRDGCREIADALRLGAFAVIDRPQSLADLDLVLGVFRRILERHYRGRWPGTA